MRFNTGIAAMMEFVNGAYKWDTRPRAVLAPFVLLLAAYAPHLGEEMWQVGHLQSAGWDAMQSAAKACRRTAEAGAVTVIMMLSEAGCRRCWASGGQLEVW